MKLQIGKSVRDFNKKSIAFSVVSRIWKPTNELILAKTSTILYNLIRVEINVEIIEDFKYEYR
jgi:hypothetical protein